MLNFWNEKRTISLNKPIGVTYRKFIIMEETIIHIAYTVTLTNGSVEIRRTIAGPEGFTTSEAAEHILQDLPGWQIVNVDKKSIIC